MGTCCRWLIFTKHTHKTCLVLPWPQPSDYTTHHRQFIFLCKALHVARHGSSTSYVKIIIENPGILLDLLVVGVNEALRFVAWLTAGGGGGMAGGVDLGWVFTSAGESGIVPTVCTLLPVMWRGKKQTVINMEHLHGWKKLTFKVETAG